MQRIIYFLIRNKNFILFLSLLAVCLSINLNYNEYNKSKLFNSSNSFFSTMYNIKLTISKYFNLEYQNRLLTEENRGLRFQIYNSIDSLEYKSQAEKILRSGIAKPNNEKFEYKSGLEKINYEVTTASVIKNSYSYSNNFITIDAGKKDSIEVDNGVISSKGVVGIIDKISLNYSRFISILNTNFLLNAKLKKSGYFGVLSWDGNDIYKVQLKDIPKQANVVIGDTIVTGGNSLIFPKGILIGYVDSYKLDNSENYFELEIQLATDMTNIEKIYVLKNNNLIEINSLDE
ncbi:MAG: rod shape-determining protein MreC [Flavobacteriaceae bacterium]|nr:rod shape-determining protein MreC [Flavobacteriaceae bacterium]